MLNVKTHIHELQQRMVYTLPGKYCAVLVASHFSQQIVFNVLNPQQMDPSFDVYLDCSLAELAMTVEASLLH